MTQSTPHDVSDRQLDEDLRRALEPSPGVAERLARQALEHPDVEARRSPWLRPALLAAALLALVSVSTWVLPHFVSETEPDVTDRPATTDPGGFERPDPTQEPPTARLSISNLDGPVTVTTADGTRWIALSSSSDSSTTGDPVS